MKGLSFSWVRQITPRGPSSSTRGTARRLSTSAVRLDDLHFFYLHLRWQFVGLAAMIGAATILSDPIFQGLAISLLFGLASSTLLTVLVIPAIYVVLRDDGKAATR